MRILLDGGGDYGLFVKLKVFFLNLLQHRLFFLQFR